MPNKYTYVFATLRHQPVRTLTALKKTGRWNAKLGFYCNGQVIGEAHLLPLKNGDVHTEGVGLDDGFRNKGHGLPLYQTLIRLAKRLGARRIYSSHRLNRKSRRMWSEKLAAIYHVEAAKTNRRCRRCGCKCAKIRYFIRLADV